MTIFEQDFEAMLRKYAAALDDKKRFPAFVKDLFPDQARNVNLLLIAYNMGIAQDIQNTSRINHAFAFRYVKRLMDEFGMSRVHADWIVSVWCVCYGTIRCWEKRVRLRCKSRGAARLFRMRSLFPGKPMGICLLIRKASREWGWR